MPQVSHADSLRAELGGDFNDQRIAAWIGGFQERSAFLTQKTLGAIVWSKQLGRPDSPALADGFVVAPTYDNKEAAQTPEGSLRTTGWIPVPDSPEVWDGPGDEAHYRVEFLARNIGGTRNAVTVTLSSVAWRDEAPGLGYRVVVPESQVFDGATNPGLTIVDFQVVAPLRPRGFEPV